MSSITMESRVEADNGTAATLDLTITFPTVWKVTEADRMRVYAEEEQGIDAK